MQVSVWVTENGKERVSIFRLSLHSGANLLCNEVKFPTLWRERKMPLKASRGRSCPPLLQCLKFKGDS